MNVVAPRILLALLLLGLSAPAFAEPVHSEHDKPHILFLAGEDPSNYEAHETIPAFAQWLENNHDFRATTLLGEGPLIGHRFPGLEVIADADLLVIFFRRRALNAAQMGLIKDYLKSGKPLVGIRTANHAFCVHEHPERGMPDGFEAWWEFVPRILGCENRGYGPQEPGTAVAPAPGMEAHPILEDVAPLEWHSKGNVYHVAPLLDEDAQVLLLGSVEETVEPIAWTRRTDDSSPVFYTSLGYPDDFTMPQFRQLLVNGIRWALDEIKD